MSGSLWFGIVCACLFHTIHSHEKRILLGDPDVISSRLGHLEQENIELRRMLISLNNSNNELLVKLNNSTSEFQKQVAHLETKIQAQEVDKDHGSTYVRWGRTVCDGSNTEKVYSGFAAGQHYYYPSEAEHRGGPANMLCLPDNPQISNATFASKYSLLEGTEYQTNDFKPGATNEDVPCAVCRSPRTSVMIPGRHTCYNGWSQEYQGILASGYLGYSASSYICMDGDPEFIQSGKADVNGFATGQHYYYPSQAEHRGGPANMLCLAENPQISYVTFMSKYSLLEGTEYEMNEFKQGAANEDVPCVLCRTPKISVMIPGRQICYNGWSLKYKGILASGYVGYSASSYICMDGDPEFIQSGQANMDGQLLYVVGYKCGPLPCPPYQNQRIADCVVCSK